MTDPDGPDLVMSPEFEAARLVECVIDDHTVPDNRGGIITLPTAASNAIIKALTESGWRPTTTISTAPDLRTFLAQATYALGVDTCGYPLLLVEGDPAVSPGGPVDTADICYPVRILWAADGPTATPPTEEQP